MSYGTIIEKVVPSAFPELEKHSQMPSARKSALESKLSTTVQPRSEPLYHMHLTQDPVGVYRLGVC